MKHDKTNDSTTRRAWIPAAIALCLVAGCNGGLHHKGEQRFSVIGSYGEPFNESFVWKGGDGSGQEAALTLGYDYFLEDRLALIGTVTPYRIYNQSDGDTYAGEIQLGLRYYIWEFELFSTPGAVYGEMLGGVTYGSRSIPEEGSSFDFTQDTGLGMEMQISDDVSWFTGYRLKHLSNGNFFNDDNPAQNEHFVYLGVAFSW